MFAQEFIVKVICEENPNWSISQEDEVRSNIFQGVDSQLDHVGMSPEDSEVLIQRVEVDLKPAKYGIVACRLGQNSNIAIVGFFGEDSLREKLKTIFSDEYGVSIDDIRKVILKENSGCLYEVTVLYNDDGEPGVRDLLICEAFIY